MIARGESNQVLLVLLGLIRIMKVLIIVEHYNMIYLYHNENDFKEKVCYLEKKIILLSTLNPL